MSAGRSRPVICTDDGWILSTEPPVTFPELREKVVAPHRGTPAALWWSVGDHEVYHYETQVGEIVGESYEGLTDETKRVADNTRHLMATRGGPLTALAELCRESDIELFSRVRMNSHYRIDPASPRYGRFRREHPELLIGRPGEVLPKGSMEWAIRTGLNYRFSPVREHMARIIVEQFERFDVDGVEMDFMRHPTFFRPEEAYASRHLMTDLIRHVRERMKRVSAARGRPLELAVRVPPTLANSAKLGLDVERWIDEGLVDIVVAGMGWSPFETPLGEFVEAARETGVQVYGSIEASRPAVDENVIRALASRFWSLGASGTYLYNFYTMSAEWKRRILNEIADPATLSRLDKRYELDHTIMPEPLSEEEVEREFIFAVPEDRYVQIMSVFRYAIPSAQLPVVIEETFSGRGPVLRLEIADELEAARADGALGSCVLALRFDNLMTADELEVRLNGEVVPIGPTNVSFSGWTRLRPEPRYWTRFPTQPIEVTEPGASVELDVGCPPVRQGENELEVRIGGRGSKQTSPVVLKGVEVTIRYSGSSDGVSSGSDSVVTPHTTAKGAFVASGQSPDSQAMAEAASAMRASGLDMPVELVGRFVNRLSPEEVSSRCDRLGEWLRRHNRWTYDGVMLTPTLVEHLSEPGDFESLLSELDGYMDETRAGRFRFDNPLQRALEFKRFAVVDTDVVTSAKSYEELLEGFEHLEELPPEQDDEYMLTEEQRVEARRTAFEAVSFLRFLREFRAGTKRPIVVIGNDRYGREWVVEPIADHLRNGFTVRHYRVPSHKNFRLRTHPLFPSSFVHEISEQMPNIVVVDGSSPNKSRDLPMFSRAIRGYANWFVAFNDLRSEGDGSRYERESCLPSYHFPDLRKWHEFVTVRKQIEQWVKPGPTYKVTLWAPEQNERAQFGEFVVPFERPDTGEERPLVVLANSIIYRSESDALPDALRGTTPYYFDGPEKYLTRPHLHDAIGHPQENILRGFGPYGLETRVEQPSHATVVATIQRHVKAEVQALLEAPS